MKKVVEVTFPGGMKVDANMDGIIIKTDQSVLSGGEGSAPEPFQLFLTSIATCAGIYAIQFCRARQIDTHGLSLKMICSFDPDLKRYTEMKLDLTLPKEFPEKYHDGIKRAMDLCAVKRHIIEPPDFIIELRCPN